MTNILNAILVILALTVYVIVLIIGYKVHSRALQVSNKKDKPKEDMQLQ